MLSVTIQVSVKDIVDGFPHDEDAAFELIREMDLRRASYDFTKRLADYFAAEIAKEDALP